MKIRQLLPLIVIAIGACLWTAVPDGRAEPGKAAVRILAFGDSLTAGYGLPREAAFPIRLEQALRAKGYAATVINAGVSGDTTAGGKARIGWALSENPDLVIVELGGNDGLRGIDPAASERNLAAILETVRKHDIAVLLTGMEAPPNLGDEYAAQFRAVFPRLARRFDVPLYPFFLDGVAATRRYNQRDGIHPNAEGVRVIVARILPHIERVLRDAAWRRISPPVPAVPR